MKTLSFLMAGAIALTSITAAQAFEAKHMSRGITCEKCHKTSAPAAAPKSKVCFECHSYADVAKRTAKDKPNPHDSHAGEVKCIKCHAEHKKSVLYCDECHAGKKFTFKRLP